MRQQRCLARNVPAGQEAEALHSVGWGVGGVGGSGGVGLGVGGLAVFFTGYEGTMATPHWPWAAVSRLRTRRM